MKRKIKIAKFDLFSGPVPKSLARMRFFIVWRDPICEKLSSKFVWNPNNGTGDGRY